jgi:hypothetical protein
MVKAIDKTPKRKQIKTIVDRVADLEQNQQGILQALNQLMLQTNDRLNNQAEITSAIAEFIGTEKVQQLVTEARDRRDAENVAKAEKYIKDQVEAGNLEPAEVLSAKSTVVGVEMDKDGKALKPGRIQIPFTNILPDLQEQLLGKPAGTRVETKGGTTFEVLEIYDIVEKPTAVPVPVELPESEEEGNPSTLAPAEELEQLEAAAGG